MGKPRLDILEEKQISQKHPMYKKLPEGKSKEVWHTFFFLILTWLMICLILPSGILIISLFQKWLIVLLSLLQKVEQPENSVQMLRVTDNTGHRTSMKEIGNALDRSKLDSNDVIIVSAPKSIWVWIGKGKLNFC